MSGNKTSLSTEVQHDETLNNNRDMKQDFNSVDQAKNQSAQTTDLQTNKDDKGNPLPSTSQIPNSDAKTHDSPNSPPTSNQTNSPKKQDTNQDGAKIASTEKESGIIPNEERNHLVNLIGEEIKFVENICPKLGKDMVRVKMEAKKVSDDYVKLRYEPCELIELKDLKKRITKLKLQIPAKYRTYDETEKQKNQQSHVESKDISSKLLKQMPRLHDKLFHQSYLCKAIHLRFNELSCELKLCLLCFSVFPEKATISRRAMVYWWIGEGFIPREGDLESERTVEDCANDIFNELIDKDFIEPDHEYSKSSYRHAANCKMHPMVRAALIMIADKVNFFDFDRFGDPKDFGKDDEIESPEDLPRFYPLGDPREFFNFFDESRNSTSENIEFTDPKGNPNQFAALDNENPVDLDGKEINKGKKHYFYERKKITTKSYKVCLVGSGLSKGISWEKLHVLFNVKENILEFKPEWFSRMKNINVIFLGRWQSSAAHHIEVDEFDLENSLDYMDNLRLFSLQGVSRVSKLPTSISKLKTLLMLDLRACHNLEVIPKTIGSLKLLTHLDISECYLLKEIPKEISLLKSLQVLKGFVVVESPESVVCTLQDLIKLENLRKLSMYTHMKDFPQKNHLEALQKLETLRKLTILWGGHESKPKTTEPKQDVLSKKKQNIVSKVRRLVPKKKQVEGSLKRMNAFSNSTIGARLEKLDLKCFPHHDTPNWLTAGSLKGLKKLYIRGGSFSDLGQYQDSLQWDDSSVVTKETWNVGILRLKYLEELNMEWREFQNLFPKLTSLEKVKCPRLTLFPCNEHGIWRNEGSMTT
ncbi:hypothetical protein R6Q57_003494 [Mikania cordata]